MPDHTQPSAPSLLKGLVKGTSLYSVALLGQRIASLILLPLNTHFLTRADYGVLDLLEQIGVVVSVLLGLNISSALGYFYFKEKSPEARNTVVGTILAGATLVGIFAGIGGALLANPIGRLAFGTTDYRPYLLLVFLSLPMSAALEALFSWLRVTDRPEMYVFASLLRVAITIVMTVILVAVLKLRVFGVLGSSLTAIALPAIFLGIYCLRKMRLTFQRRLFLNIFRFSFPIGLASAAMFIINFGDRFILRYYRSLDEVGVYAVGYKIGMLMSFVHSSFHTYWSSQVYAVARRDDADFVIARIFTYMMLALSLALVALIVVCRPAMHILVTRPGFEEAAFIAPLIVIAYYLRAIGDFFRCFLLVEGHSNYDAVCSWMGASVCLIAYFILIPRFGMWGAAISTLLTFLTIAVISAIWAFKVHPFRVEGNRLFKIFAVSSGLLAVYFALPMHALAVQIVWALLLIAAFPASLWALRFARPEEISKVQSVLNTAVERARRLLPG